MKIIQIVPRLPPAIDGVGDYAFLLARQLRAAHGIHTQFIVCDPNSGKSGIELDGFPVYRLKERTVPELLRALSQPGMPETVLLQYVGYGYQSRGCPVWLARGLRAWEMGRPTLNARRLVTMFHEISATGPVWGSAFWTAPVQRWMAKFLARLSGHCFTNLKLHANTLQQFMPGNESEVTVRPVFSNVGEPENLPDWNERQPRMIVFGSAGWRRKVYEECKADLEEACCVMGLDEIVDIGAAVEIPPLSVRVSRRGILTAAEAGREMLSARAGFFAYPVNCLGKSGIFAAYAAHGLVPVTFETNGVENLDGLSLGKHFISANALQVHDADRLKSMGKDVREWYDGHALQRQAAAFAGKIGQACQKA